MQRLAVLCSKNDISNENATNVSFLTGENADFAKYREMMEKFEYSKAFDFVWELVQGLNKRIDDEKPWVLAKNGETEKLADCLHGLVDGLLQVKIMLSPFLPGTAEKIGEIFTGKIEPPKQPLFPKQ